MFPFPFALCSFLFLPFFFCFLAVSLYIGLLVARFCVYYSFSPSVLKYHIRRSYWIHLKQKRATRQKRKKEKVWLVVCAIKTRITWRERACLRLTSKESLIPHYSLSFSFGPSASSNQILTSLFSTFSPPSKIEVHQVLCQVAEGHLCRPRSVDQDLCVSTHPTPPPSIPSVRLRAQSEAHPLLLP